VIRAYDRLPTNQNLGGAGIGNGAFAQTALDLRVRGRLTLTARSASSWNRPTASLPIRTGAEPS
jgi:hypothetical protein